MISPRNVIWMHQGGLNAAEFYVALFDDAEIENHFGSNPNAPDEPLIINFRLVDARYQILNVAGEFTINPAFSISITTHDQAETDRFYGALADGGREMACSWVTDKFGVSWQIVPQQLIDGLADPDPKVAMRVNQAMMQMQKIDIATIEAARKG